MNILGVIPARGGSKGLPGKNIKRLGGIPLVAHTILAARRARGLSRLHLSTDDSAIAAVGRTYGLEVPWLRPRALARDKSSVVDAILHLLDRLATDEGYEPDAVMVLQPTSPFRSAKTIRRAIAAFKTGGRTVISVISVTSAHNHPYWAYRLGADGRLAPFLDIGTPPPRQRLPPAYALDGSIALIRTSLLRRDRGFYKSPIQALVVSPEEGVDIDTPSDWELAETVWRKRRRGEAPRDRSVYVIAEAGVNHDGSLARAKALAAAAKKAGADAVKFQSFNADSLVCRDAPKAPYQKRGTPGKSHRQMLTSLELSPESHRVLLRYCRSIGITFLSTPFDEASADMLDGLGVPLFKLSSGDLTNKPLIQHVARKRKPLILSTGMSDTEEVAAALDWFHAAGGAEATLLHCVTEYPAPKNQCNLLAIDSLRESFQVPVGFSDHTPGIDIAIAAAARGASVIEKHLTLDKSLPGPDHAASLEPAEFRAMVSSIRSVSGALGDGVKRPARCELKNVRIGRRSVVTAKTLEPGHVITRGDLLMKRPGTGIPPARADELLGRAARRRIEADSLLAWSMLR